MCYGGRVEREDARISLRPQLRGGSSSEIKTGSERVLFRSPLEVVRRRIVVAVVVLETARRARANAFDISGTHQS